MATIVHHPVSDRPHPATDRCTIAAFGHLLRLSRSRFAAQHYEAAYHALAAALF